MVVRSPHDVELTNDKPASGRNRDPQHPPRHGQTVTDARSHIRWADWWRGLPHDAEWRAIRGTSVDQAASDEL